MDATTTAPARQGAPSSPANHLRGVDRDVLLRQVPCGTNGA